MRIVIIGTGNVAYHFMKALYAAQHEVICVASRTYEHALHFARMADELSHESDNGCSCNATDNVSLVPADADLYLIAVSDDAISDVSQRMPSVKGVVVHTSGATPIDVLQSHKHRAVIYPCQTLSRADVVDFAHLPLMVEAVDAESEHVAVSFASSLSNNVGRATSEQRLHIHLAAVLVSNFTNHLIALAKQHSDNNGIDYRVLKSLVCQTVDKAFRMDPVEAQTGPAIRHDEVTINRHLQMIDDASVKEIYKLLTHSIQNHSWK
ncbi:MAG: DUF2520 domain-containing protein [Bacteroidales bacterium]|nr:DUF2520 domain-containing protein [Bacteroidales bacterium]